MPDAPRNDTPRTDESRSVEAQQRLMLQKMIATKPSWQDGTPLDAPRARFLERPRPTEEQSAPKTPPEDDNGLVIGRLPKNVQTGAAVTEVVFINGALYTENVLTDGSDPVAI